MNINEILILGVCAGVYSFTMSMNYNSPKPALIISFICSFFGIVIRDILHNNNLSLTSSSFISALIISLIALFACRNRKIAYVTCVSCFLPLGAAIPFFKMAGGILKIPDLRGNELSSVINSTIADASEVITIYIAIIWGGLTAIALMRLLEGKEKNII